MGSISCALKVIKYPKSLRKLSEFHFSIMCFSLKEKKGGKKISILPHCIEQFLKSSPIPVNNTASTSLATTPFSWLGSFGGERQEFLEPIYPGGGSQHG